MTGTDGGLSTRTLASTERFGSGAIAFHWVMVPLIVAVGVLGLLHDSWSKQSQGFWINIHALIGGLVWMLVIARFWWRIRHPSPALPQSVGEISRRLSAAMHGLLYLLMFVIPIIGVVTFVWHGRAFNFGLFQLKFAIRSNREIFHPTEDIHGYLAYALFALAGMHVMAALWHHFVKRDSVLLRMWPNLRKERSSSHI
jgi:cytochrome b561